MGELGKNASLVRLMETTGRGGTRVAELEENASLMYQMETSTGGRARWWGMGRRFEGGAVISDTLDG